MKEIINILVERDGLSFEEAKAVVKDVIAEIKEIIAGGGDYFDIEEVVADELGIEMDFVEPILFGLVGRVYDKDKKND